jgi:hypothetical protein
MRDRHWQDWMNLFLAGWLFITPWFYNFTAIPGAAWNAWVVGALVAIFALVALARNARWPQFGIAALGVWLAVSPWIVGGAGMSAMMWNFVLIGALMIAFAVAAIATQRRRVGRRTAL